MLVRNQVRRHLGSKYGAVSRQTPAPRSAESVLDVEGGTLFTGIDAVLRGISIGKKRGEGPSLLRSGLNQDSLPSRKTYSTATPLSPKSTTRDGSPEANSYQVISVVTSIRISDIAEQHDR